MVDGLVVWGIVQAAGVLVKPIVEDLAKDATRDYTKDFFKNCLKQVIRLPEPDVRKEACGKALKEFLELVEQELETAGYQEAQIKLFIQPLKQFVRNEKVAAILGQAFEADCRAVDTTGLAQAWQSLNLPMPPEFDWDLVGKLYVRKVKIIVQKSEKLRPIFAAESQAAAAESLQELVGVAPEFDLRRYAEGLREQYGNLKLESLDTTGAYYSELKLWKVFVPQTVRGCQEFLPQIHEIPKEHLRQLRDRGELSEAELAETELAQHRRVYGEQTLRSVLEVVSNPVGEALPSAVQYAVVLGDPGAGKSSLLQFLALGWAEQPLSQLPLHPIPLLIELRTYARDKQERKCTDLLSFIHGGNVTCHLNQQQLHNKLRAGQAIALFDGVDEVFDPQVRDEVVTDIHRFTNDYPQVRVVVTSRWLGYKAQRLRDAGFAHFMLQDLEEEQIQEFVQRWHDLTFGAGLDRGRKQERLERAIRDSKSIRELAGNPLLLTMMAILNRNQELPRDRPELYNQASRVLLHQWDVERALVEDRRLDPKTIDYRDKQAMLRKVAHFMQSSQKGLAGNIIGAADLERILMDYLKTIEVEQPRTVARLMINQLRTRNFILCYLGADSYAFVHRTFLEYFCAWEFVWQFKETQTLSIEQLTEEVFGRHWQDEAWEEVMCLISGMIDASFTGKIIAWLLEQPGEKDEFANLFLAAKCLAEVRNRAEIVPLAHQLSEQIKALTANYQFQIQRRAVSAVAATWQEEPSTFSWLKALAQSGKGGVRIAAVQELARGWKENLETLPILKTFAQSDETYFVRGIAVAALARGWKDDPETLPILKTRTQSDENYFVRRIAVQELSCGWKEDPETLLILKTRAQSDENGDVRRAAVQELARGWKENPETLPWLKTRAQSDANYDVRLTAVQELALAWKDDPEILPMLKICAQFDEDNIVRITAVQKLARGWKDDSQMFEFLSDRALNDPFKHKRKGKRKEDWRKNPRQTALEAVVENYPDNPKTLELLHDRALNDPDEQVREYAKEQLAKLE